MTKRRAASYLALGALLLTRVAFAQSQNANTVAQGSPAWLADRRYNEGIGVRTGDLELHPGLAGEVGYDSNFFLRSTQQASNGPPSSPVVPSAVVRVTPSLYLSTIGPERLQGEALPPAVMFKAGVNATYRAMFGLSSDASQPSNDPSKQDAISGAGDLRLDILSGRPAGAALFGSFARTIQPNTGNADPNVSFNRDDVRAGGELVIQPGGGTLEWRLGYEFDDTLFENSPGVPYDNYTHQIYTRGRWRFRPRTAFVYDGSIRFITYTDPQPALDQGLVDSTPVRARIGLNGLVTERFAAQAMVGWGASFDTGAVQTQQYDSVIGQAELKWYLAANPGTDNASDVSLSLSSIALGYTRDFQTSYIGNYYGIDRGYLRFYYLFAGRVLVTLDAGLAAIEYPNLVAQKHASFTDARADATLLGEYRFTETFGINSTLRYTQNFSNQTIQEAPPATGTYGMAWQRYEAYLGLRWFM